MWEEEERDWAGRRGGGRGREGKGGGGEKGRKYEDGVAKKKISFNTEHRHSKYTTM